MGSSEAHHTDQRRTYDRQSSVVFLKTHEAFGGLSNMAGGFPLVVNGIRILTSEALYQACRFPHMPDVQRLIIEQRSPMTAKMKGKPFRKQSRPDWMRVRVRIMKWCLRVKLAMHWRDFGNLLLETGDRSIVEQSRRDDFWGALAQDDDTLVGMNVLGRLLMDLRDKLKSPDKEEMRIVEPPPLDNFLLYGEPIGPLGFGSETVRTTHPDVSARPGTLWELPALQGPQEAFKPTPLPVGTISEPLIRIEPTIQTERPMKYPKRLIEVDLPVRTISRNAAAEMEKRRGHVPMMHIWWAHRPPVACRAILLSSILPDPLDPKCPPEFIERVAEIISDYWSIFGGARRNLDDKRDVRQALLDIVAMSSEYDLRTNRHLIRLCRELIDAASPQSTPHLLDPFCGGGVIPFEGIRLGLEVTATDLNPVAVLITKAVVEHVPRYGNPLIGQIEHWAKEFHQRLWTQLGRFYPSANNGETPVAYLWARKLRCEGPGCGAEIPMIRQMWLSRKGKRKAALVLKPNPDRKEIEIDIIQNPRPDQIQSGTVRGGSVTCPLCGFTTRAPNVKAQLSKRGGGTNDARLLAVVTTVAEQTGRHYRLPLQQDLAAIGEAYKFLDANRSSLSLPNEPLPNKDRHRAVGLQLPLYGFCTWSDLFTKRQLLALCSLARIIREGWSEILDDVKDEGMANAIIDHLSLLLDKMADMNTSLCVWQTHAGIPAHLFGRKALPMVMDFAEAVPVGQSSGTLVSGLKRTLSVLKEYATMNLKAGLCMTADATHLPFPNSAYDLCFTDPPYYDSVPYADLSDFFYVWLKRSAGTRSREFLSLTLTDKENEAIVNHPESDEERKRYKRLLTESWREARRTLKDDGLLLVVFAHKSTAAWETIMESLLESDLTIVASWPIDTEMRSRMNAKETASLSSSIHLVCRPRTQGLNVESFGDWREVRAEMPKRIHEWMPRLSQEGIVGADAIFACLGPALEVFSRYSRVEKASGEQVTLREYLEHVWAAVSQEALRMVFEGADASGFEEDARLTAMWLWTLSTGKANGKTESAIFEESEDKGGSKKAISGHALEYDTARKIAQGLGAHLETLQSVVAIEGETARLLPVAERTAHLFGKSESAAPKGSQKKAKQRSWIEELKETEPPAVWGEKSVPRAGQTVLDRVHQTMILFAAGRSEALKRLLVEEGIGRDSRFWTLAQALSALYPTGSDEKRWVDGVLARKKGLGF